MALAPINWNPNHKTLREFSEAGMAALGLLVTPLALLRGHGTAAAVAWCLAVGIRIVGLVRPGWLRPVFVGLTVLTWPIGWLVSHLVLGGMYLLVFTPIALVFRLVGRDALQRRFDRAAPTYWEPYEPDQGLERYLRQY